jgi:hypothetical protein
MDMAGKAKAYRQGRAGQGKYAWQGSARKIGKAGQGT